MISEWFGGIRHRKRTNNKQFLYSTLYTDTHHFTRRKKSIILTIISIETFSKKGLTLSDIYMLKSVSIGNDVCLRRHKIKNKIMKRLFFIMALLLCWGAVASAQIQIDSFNIDQIFWVDGKKMKWVETSNPKESGRRTYINEKWKFIEGARILSFTGLIIKKEPGKMVVEKENYYLYNINLDQWFKLEVE